MEAVVLCETFVTTTLSHPDVRSSISALKRLFPNVDDHMPDYTASQSTSVTKTNRRHSQIFHWDSNADPWLTTLAAHLPA